MHHEAAVSRSIAFSGKIELRNLGLRVACANAGIWTLFLKNLVNLEVLMLCNQSASLLAIETPTAGQYCLSKGAHDMEPNAAGGCAFCDIAKGVVPASIVFANEHILAFLSLEQPNPYKVSIIPREHVATIYDLTDEQAAHIFQAAVRIARAIRRVSGNEGLNIVQSNGILGQQDIFHVHVHLVPRVAGDTQQGRIVLDWDNTPRERKELDRLATDLRLLLQSQSE